MGEFRLEENPPPHAPPVVDENPEFHDEVGPPESENIEDLGEEEPVVYQPATIEDVIKSGKMQLDYKGRMPGIYLDDIEEIERLRTADLVEKLHKEIKDPVIVQRELNVASSPLPPMQVLEQRGTVDNLNLTDESGAVQNELQPASEVV